MTELTQTEIYELVNAEYKKFLTASMLITERNDCAVSVADSICDMLSYCSDGMSEIKAVARHADIEADIEEAKAERKHEKIESAMLRR